MSKQHSPTAIREVKGYTALDSRGRPTLKVKVKTWGGEGWALSPSGASKGSREAVELRDGGRRWAGYGVSKALAVLESVVAPRLVGIDSRRQDLVDNTLVALDGTGNKSRLGGNTTTAVSLAVARAAASTLGVELYRYLGGPSARRLPVPVLNVINGGAHAGNDLDIQEFMIVPVGFDSFIEALRAGVEIYHELKKIISSKYGKSATNVGDEGGYAPPLSKTREALDLLAKAVESAGYSLDRKGVALGLDVAASHFYRDGLYHVDGQALDREGMIDYITRLAGEYPLVYIEDPLYEDDVQGFKAVSEALKGKAVVVGDDYYTTNTRTLRERSHTTTGVLVKVNQIGTLTEALDFISEARRQGQRIVVSHRSGDTEDPFIADLAVAVGAEMIKTGAPARGERTAKYNRLLEIEDDLGPAAIYASTSILW